MNAQEARSRILSLREEIHKHNHAYHALGKPTITDAEFDGLYRELLALEKEWPAFEDANSPTQRVGSPIVSSFETVKHLRKMLSLDNAYNVVDLVNFFNHPDLADYCGVVEPKIDGLSLALHYEEGKLVRAVTRGDGSTGDDVTANARTIASIPLVLDRPLTIEVRGEAYMSFAVFNQLNEVLRAQGEDEFANPRNAAVGSLKLQDTRITASRKLSFIAYNVADPMASLKTASKAYKQVFGETHETVLTTLVKLGFVTVLNYPMPHENLMRAHFCVSLTDKKHLTKALAWGEEMRNFAPFATDGLVFKLNNLFIQNDLGDGTKSPKWAVAFKFPPERKTTKLLDIEVSIGRLGTLTPVAIMEAVHLSGTTVTRASLCNQDEINRLGVNVGDLIYVEKSAEIIPKVMGLYLKGNLTGSWMMPLQCPCCKTEVKKDEGMVAYYCPNMACPDQVVQRLRHAVCKSALDWDGMGIVQVESFAKEGVTHLCNLFELQDLQVIALLGKAASKKFLAERERVKKAPLWRKIHALGIEGVGRSLSQDLCARWHSLAEMIDHIGEVQRILGEVFGKNFVDYLIANQAFLDRLQSAGFLFEEEASSLGVL